MKSAPTIIHEIEQHIMKHAVAEYSKWEISITQDAEIIRGVGTNSMVWKVGDIADASVVKNFFLTTYPKGITERMKEGPAVNLTSGADTFIVIRVRT